jgi:hypothetical protein
MSYFQTCFTNAFNAISSEIPFNPTWANGTDYFNGATALDIGVGKRVKATCTSSKRRLIMVGTKLGTCVAFERFTPDIGEAFVVVSNTPHMLNVFIPSGSMDENTFQNNFGNDSSNVGTQLHRLEKALLNPAMAE